MVRIPAPIIRLLLLFFEFVSFLSLAESLSFANFPTALLKEDNAIKFKEAPPDAEVVGVVVLVVVDLV